MKARSLAPLLLVLAACDGPTWPGWTAPTPQKLTGEWEFVFDGTTGAFPHFIRFSETGEAALILEDGNPELAPTFVGPLSGDSLILARPELEATPDPRQEFHPRVKVSRDGESLKLLTYDLSGYTRDGEDVVTKRTPVWLTYRRR